MTEPASPAPSGPVPADERLTPGTEAVVAVDLGGTLAKVGLVETSGAVHGLDEVPTRREDDSVPVSWLVELVAGRAAEADRAGVAVRGFGVVVPGIVSDGRVRAAVNLGWQDLPLVDRLADGTGLPGEIGHDVRAGGLAEWRLGSGAGVDNFVFLPLGTGIAGAVVSDGRMLVADGYAGEIGHVRVVAGGEVPCACGQFGCLETVSSAAGVRRTYARLAGVSVAESPQTEVIARLARGGDEQALAAFDLAGEGLEEAVTLLATLFGPERISLGGGLSHSYDLLAEHLDHAVAALTFQRRPELVRATLGSTAGLVGAGLLGCRAAGLIGWAA